MKAMVTLKKLLVPVLVAVGLVVWAVLPSFADKHTKDIVDTAVSAGQFNTLAKALTEAGLVETLKGKGPFTVFAPTDEAFAKLPPGTLEALLNDKAKLTAVLTYHVVAGKVMAADVEADALRRRVGNGCRSGADPGRADAGDPRARQGDAP